MPSNKKFKKRKLNLVFDEDKRRDFLTGFHKRKLQRKKEAQEKLETQLKEERKKLKKEAKESYKKLVVSNRDIVGLEHILEEEYDDEDVTVKITEITAEDIAKKSNKIGFNSVQDDDEQETGGDEDVDEEEGDEDIPGMELKVKKKKKVTKEDEKRFNSVKDVKKTLKKIATQKVKKSAVFKKKGEVERKKMMKKSLRQKKENLKIRNKNLKNKHKNKSK